jgi:hypothetical protein
MLPRPARGRRGHRCRPTRRRPAPPTHTAALPARPATPRWLCGPRRVRLCAAREYNKNSRHAARARPPSPGSEGGGRAPPGQVTADSSGPADGTAGTAAAGKGGGGARPGATRSARLGGSSRRRAAAAAVGERGGALGQLPLGHSGRVHQCDLHAAAQWHPSAPLLPAHTVGASLALRGPERREVGDGAPEGIEEKEARAPDGCGIRWYRRSGCPECKGGVPVRSQ